MMDGMLDGLTDAQTRELLKPLDPAYVYFDRDGLRRVKVQYVRTRLTQIFGFAGWGEETISNALVEEYSAPRSNQKIVTFRAHIRLHIHPPHGRSTFFDGVGIFECSQGGGPDDQRGRILSVAQTKHMASMGAASAALCRAALALGDQFGGALHLDEPPTHGLIKGTLSHPFVEPDPPVSYYPEPKPDPDPKPDPTVPAQATSPEEEHAEDPTEDPTPEDYSDETSEPEYTEEPYRDRLGPEETVTGS